MSDKIKVEELRIGSWINCHFQTDNFNAKVEAINQSFEGKYFAHVTYSGTMSAYCIETNCEGIPITPEILERVGFKKGKGCFVKIYNEAGNVFTINAIGDQYLLNVYECEFKYLHQLQNAWAILTASELKYDGKES